MTETAVYLLAGPENGEKKKFITDLKKKIALAKGGEPEEYVYYPYDTETADIISLLRNASLFASAKIIIIKNCHDLKKKDISLFTDYIKTPSPDTYLVFMTDSVKAEPALEKAVPKDGKKIFWEMFESTKRGWIIQYFRSRKIAIDNSAADFICDMFESDTETLKRECENIILYFSSEQTITEGLISDLFYNSREETVYSLFEHIAACSFEKAVKTSENILRSGGINTVQVTGSILWQVRKLNRLHKEEADKVPFPDACRKLDIKSKKAQSFYRSGLENYTLEQTEKIISLIAWYDSVFRSVKQEMQNLLFPVFLYSVIKRKGDREEKRKNSFYSSSFFR